MLTKTVLVASALVGASATQAQVKPTNAMKMKTKEVGQVVDMSTVDTSAIVTTGGYAKSWSCSGQPIIYGDNLGFCRRTGASQSQKITGCEWVTAGTELKKYESTYSTTDCTGTASTYTYTYSGLVNGCDTTYDDFYECGADVTYSNYGSPQHYGEYDNTACSGAEVGWNIWFYSDCTDDGSCYSYNTYDSEKSICDDPDDTCFHVDTKIDYKGVEYTYEELKAGKEPECTVPHSPASKGVVISTSCDKTVRVTDTHLMATTKGFQLAYSLKAGDVLFGDYGKEMCTVKSVEKEKTTQQYFGLNCVHSEVLASGLRASTFGDFHTLPSWYMTYVGGLVGSETASSLGEYIAEWYFKK